MTSMNVRRKGPRAMDEIADIEQLEHDWHTQGLTATSFAVLGLLGMGEWTGYELAHQMGRSLSFFWPRATRRIYDEPRRLERAGYACSRRELVGRRPRRCWNITDDGRVALRAWLGRPPAEPPTMEFEGMLKVFLAEQAGKQQLLETLAAIGAAADRRAAELARMSAEIAADGGRFPGRVHVNALAMRYMVEVNQLTRAWARESADAVAAWHSTRTPGGPARARARADFTRWSKALQPDMPPAESGDSALL